MRKFFYELKNELLDRIAFDENHLFPYILGSINDTLSQKSDIRIPLDSVEEKISDLKSMFIIHLTGNYDPNLCLAVLFALVSLEKDIKQNNRIRSRVLYPYVDSITK